MKSKRVLLFVAILVATTGVFSCKKDSASSVFDKSYKAWLSYKSTTNNTYTYIVIHDDTIGTYWETKITVKQGNITARDFEEYDNVYKPETNTRSRVLINEWHESTASSSLGTHGADGWGLFTIDDIYYKAQNIWLKANANSNVITFTTDNRGLISAAGYTPKSCQTGYCFIGVKIKSVSN